MQEFDKKLRYETARDPAFAEWAQSVAGGENLRQCIQCGLCSATCPLSMYMDYTPRRLINLARAGFKKEVLESLTIWLCASCYACRAECPKKIYVTDIMYALKRRALEENVFPRRFPIAVLAREFGRMVFTFGRITENFLAMDLFLRTSWLKILGQTGLGLNLLRTGRMSFLPDGIRRKDELQKILNAVDASSPRHDKTGEEVKA